MDVWITNLQNKVSIESSSIREIVVEVLRLEGRRMFRRQRRPRG